MGKRPISDRNHKWTFIMNFAALAAFIIFNVVLWITLSYNDYLALDYVPVVFIVVIEVVLAAIIIVCFAMKWGRKRSIISFLVSAILAGVLIVVSILGVAFNGYYQKFIDKFDLTLDDVHINSTLSTDTYGVYVLKDDKAKALGDLKDDGVGYVLRYATEDLNEVIADLRKNSVPDLKTKPYNDVALMAKALLSKKQRAVILDQAMIDMIISAGDTTDNDKKDGPFKDFAHKIKCVYKTVNVNKNALFSGSANVTKEPFNLYISGIDTEGKVTEKSSSDVNLIVSVNPKIRQMVIISTPKDCYIPIAVSGRKGADDKLANAGVYGVDVSIKTLRRLYEIELPYYLRMNFTGFVNIIDALGGIDAYSDYAFSTHGYDFVKGKNKNLSGSEALWFTRERKAFKTGDDQRADNQMALMQSLIRKCASTSMLKNYANVLNSVSESFQTNMSEQDIKALVRYELAHRFNWNIKSYSITGKNSEKTTYSVPSMKTFVIIPDEKSLLKAKKMIRDNLADKKIK